METPRVTDERPQSSPTDRAREDKLLFKRYLGSPLYRYLVLPTFDGSGSLLSPLYYATLLIHYPLLAQLRARWPAVIPLRDPLDATPDRLA